MMTQANKTLTRKKNTLPMASTFRNGGPRRVSNSTGPAINTWGRAPNSRSAWSAAILASIDWTSWPNSTTLITVGPRLCKRSGKPTPRWSRPSTGYRAANLWPKGWSRGSCKPRKGWNCKRELPSVFFFLKKKPIGERAHWVQTKSG